MIKLFSLKQEKEKEAAAGGASTQKIAPGLIRMQKDVSELKPDGSLPDGMARRATCACHLVATDRRRQGIGSALFDRAVQHAATWGFGPLLLMVHEDDADAEPPSNR